MSKTVVLKETGKKDHRGRKTYHLYVKNVPCYYATIIEPKLKYESTTEKEYSITVFVDDETREYLENEIRINKTLCKVGVDRNKKRKIKYATEDFPLVEGLSGFNLTKNEKTRDGKTMFINVLKKEGGKAVKMTDQVGNGSIVTVKCYATYNDDDLLVAKLDTIVVEEHVPYDGNSEVHDDELGITYELQFPDEGDEEEGQTDDDDDVPFDLDDDEYGEA